ncbi:UNVERIFIED_CONTAM: hypothetical protein GTU68_046417 [Idotea baltica]|nr:hypothetical protein [Idotea baltica]
MKSDGMPTYHLANIIDDHLMKITHVIRGEEWLPSTAHHVLLYQAFGWQDTMPSFAHLPLILKPTGKGKLSKRDGDKLGIPVFPMRFKEFGFLPAAVTNFLAFLGWNPGTDQEIFDMEALIAAFNPEQIGKSGARFDFDKAKWYNHQYIAMLSDSELAELIKPIFVDAGYDVSDDKLIDIADLMKDRLDDLNQIVDKGAFLAGDITSFDLKNLRKKWKGESLSVLHDMRKLMADLPSFQAPDIEPPFKAWIQDSGLGFGKVMPIVRLALCGSLQGPDLFRVMEVMGREEVLKRMDYAIEKFPEFSVA